MKLFAPRRSTLVALAAALVALALAGCGSSDKSVVGVTVAVTPKSATVAAGASQQFLATVGGTTDTLVSWQVTGVPVNSIDSNGVLTVPSGTALGTTISVKAVSVVDNTKYDTATVTVGGGAVVVAVAPHEVNVNAGASQQFTATVEGTVNTSVHWSVSGVSATALSASGLLTVPVGTPTGTVIFVMAASNDNANASDSATVHVTTP